MQKLKQIIAIGGGGFSSKKTPTNTISISEYFLKQTGKSNPKICFIPTASGESQSYIVNFYQAFTKLNCQPSHLSFFSPHTADLESFILEQDAIYVGGGNTKSSNCPHYDGEAERRPAYHTLLLEGKLEAGIAIDDNVAVHFIDGKVFNVVKSNPKANAYYVFKKDNIIQEKPIEKHV